MTSPNPNPTLDAVLRGALTRRAHGDRSPIDLVEGVIGAVAAIPQRRAWTSELPESRWLRLLIVVAVIAAFVAGLVIGAGDQRATLPASGGTIAFVHVSYDASGNGRLPADPTILFVSPNSGQPAPLAMVPGEVVQPIVTRTGGSPIPTDYRHPSLIGPAVASSPDGSQLAFRLFNGAPGIYVMSSDGNNLTRLVDLPADERGRMALSDALDWSPDGSRIAYAYPYGSPDTSTLHVVNVDDRAPKPVDLGISAYKTVAWSPDGSKLAFGRRFSHVSTGLFIVNTDGLGERRLVAELQGHVDGVAWSPDGSRLAFEWNGNPIDVDGGRYVVNADGSGLRALLQTQVLGGCCTFIGLDTPIEWSPDGKLIAVVESREGHQEVVMLVNADGSGHRDLGDGSYFDWSPDGSQLVISEAGGPRFFAAGIRPSDVPADPYSVYVINVDGSGRRWIANGEFATWLPLP